MKVKLGDFALVYPVPIVLAGALVEGRPNYVTLGDCGLMGVRPPLVYISMHRDHYTTQGVLENGVYSINFPTTALLTQVDYCGIVSGRDVDKSALFTTFYGELPTAPLIAECPVNLECRVAHEFSIQHRHIFVGEVVQAHVEETLVEHAEGARPQLADLRRFDPILYGLDNRYYRLGDPIGWGYQEGRALKAPA